MVDHKVLITTSGIGSRLGKLTDFTNKSLVRIGDKPSISHIIEYYPEDTHPLTNGLTGEVGDNIGGFCYTCLFGPTGDPEDFEDR